MDDASTDGSYETMCEFKRAYDRLGKGEGGDEETCVGRWKEDDEIHPNREADARDSETSWRRRGASRWCENIAKAGRHAVIVKKLERSEELRSGQGLALNLAYALSTCEYVAGMEGGRYTAAKLLLKVIGGVEGEREFRRGV